eukprot:3322371-Rhodomonas_salina.5
MSQARMRIMLANAECERVCGRSRGSRDAGGGRRVQGLLQAAPRGDRSGPTACLYACVYLLACI